ncbi:MAG: hypothetical protein Q9M36_09000 [Sulfurovum sp.]|nr:hypothetical protein [Sulfurovum sp.]
MDLGLIASNKSEVLAGSGINTQIFMPIQKAPNEHITFFVYCTIA